MMRFLFLLAFVSCATPLAALPIRTPGASANKPGPGELTAEEVIEVVCANEMALASCVRTHHGDHGKIVLVWDVRPDGTVENAAVRDAEFATNPLAHCFINSLKTWRFAPTEKGGTAIVFPIKL